MTKYDRLNREPWEKVDVEPGQVKDWISITGDEEDKMYEPSTVDTDSDVRAFAWRAKDDAQHEDTDPACQGELLVEYDPDAEDAAVGEMRRFGVGPTPVPLRVYLSLKFAARAEKTVPIKSPLRGGKPESSVGEFIEHELGWRAANAKDAFGYRDNFETFTPEDL